MGQPSTYNSGTYTIIMGQPLTDNSGTENELFYVSKANLDNFKLCYILTKNIIIITKNLKKKMTILAFETQNVSNTFIGPPLTDNTEYKIPIISWPKKTKIIQGNTECPVTFNNLYDEYICCLTCQKKIDIIVKNFWIECNKNCTHCRQN